MKKNKLKRTQSVYDLSCSEEDPMDVYYEQTPSSALKRVSTRIGAIPENNVQECFNYVTTFPAMAAGWNYLLLNGLTLGTGASNRIGREIMMRELDFYVSPTASRFMIVYDRQSNGGAPSSTDLTQDSTDLQSPWSFTNRDRFDILWDSQWDRTPEQAIISYQKGLPIGLCTYYNSGNAGTVADITSGALYLAIWSQGAAGGPGVSLMLYYEE